MKPMRFLVTAGNTRERIDDVRDWGNIFTGNTGFAIARALAAVGEVDLLTSNRQHLAELEGTARSGALPIRGIAFTTHADLRDRLANQMQSERYDGVFMSAAVADYTPVRTYRVVGRETGDDGRERWVVEDVQAGKVGSSYEQIAILGQRTEKLVDLFRSAWGYRGLLVKFKLEVGRTREELIVIGRRSRLASDADYLVANTLDMTTGPNAGAYLISAAGEEWIARADLPARLVQIVQAP
jgi:phosphopantothenate---cysteine ligase (CTP)